MAKIRPLEDRLKEAEDKLEKLKVLKKIRELTARLPKRRKRRS